MATTTKTTKKTDAKKSTKSTKKTVKATERPESAAPAVDPFAQAAPASGTKKAPVGDNIHNAPSDDAELGNVAADIAEFAKAKAEYKAAEARFKAVSGTVMSYAKRVLLGLIAKTGSKPKGQKLVGDDGAIVTTFYQDRTVSMDGDNVERYETAVQMFGQEITDAQIAQFSGWSIADEKMADEALVAKMKEALQAALTADELTGLFVAKHTSRKGVVDNAAKLCDKDADKIDMLLQLTVPKPTLK